MGACSQCGSDSCNCKKYVEVIQGEDRTLNLQIQRADNGSFDITGASEITANFRKFDNTILTLTKTASQVSIADAPAGKIQVIISSVNSAILNPTTSPQDFWVSITIGGITRIVNFISAILVLAPSV